MNNNDEVQKLQILSSFLFSRVHDLSIDVVINSSTLPAEYLSFHHVEQHISRRAVCCQQKNSIILKQ
jgi:hypothetical protein